MKREFTINIILLLIINFLIKPLYIFGVDARIQNLIGIDAYGMYFYYFNFVFLFQFINDPGILNWNAQYVPKNRDSISQHIPNLISVKGFLGFIFLITVTVIAYIFDYQDIHLIVFLAINTILSTFFIILRNSISGLGYYRIDSWISALDKLLMIFILGYLAWISSYQQHFEISALIYGQGIAYAIACIVATAILYKKIKFKKPQLSYEYLLEVLKYSFPFVLILIFMTAYNKLDGVMLGAMLDDHHHQAGIYASAYRFYDAANMIAYLFAALLLPMYAANIYNHSVLNDLKSIGLRLVTFSAILIVLSVFFYGDKILMIIYDAYEPSIFSVLKYLMLSYLMVAIAYIFGTMLVANGKVKNLNILFGLGLIINIFINYLLIPKYGAIGAAISTYITQSLVMVGQIYLVHKEIGINISKDEILRLTGWGLFSVLIFITINASISIQWYYNLGISIIICVLLSLILKIFDKEEITNIMFKEKHKVS